MSDLRKSLIRLAHAKPALRAHLLPLLKHADAEVGPYLKFNNRIWVNEVDAKYGGKMNTRPGNWTRLRLSNEKGEILRTEVEVKFTKPGHLTVHQSHRTQPEFKYEDLGMIKPKFDFLKGQKDYTEAKAIAHDVARQWKAKGGSVEAAQAFVSEILTDVNFHSLVRVLPFPERTSEDFPLPYGDVSMKLDFDVVGAAYFGYYLLSYLGDKAGAAVLAAKAADALGG